MSRINLHNYEAFLLDLAEGTITPADEQELMLFLTEHPELDVDIDGIAYATLDDDGITFAGKDNLKKTGTGARFEVLAVKQLEEGLTKAEQKELDAIVETDGKYAAALTAYGKTVLVADKSIVFEGKGALKQGAAIRPLWYYAPVAAAAVALLIGIYIFNQQNIGTTVPLTAESVEKETTTKGIAKENAGTTTIARATPEKVNATNAVAQPRKIKRTNPTIEVVKDVEPLYTKATPVTIDLINPTVAVVQVEEGGYNDMMASAFALPAYGIDEPAPKQNLLNTLLAKARIGIKENVKDTEMAARLDTITKRGPNLSDLAFMGSKGFERITGIKPNIRRVEDEANNTSGLVIGRYTIITSRKNK